MKKSKKLAAMDTEVSTQLATKATTDQVKAVSGEVGVVRTDLDTTKKDLHMARSEMGTLIAKNHDDIETLRRFGERDYTEFTMAVKYTPQKVGDITIELRSTDAKKNQCNMAIVVDDKRTEKRNRTINEPIFFYAHGARQPMEVVINQVEKNKVTGYLSVPKVMEPRCRFRQLEVNATRICTGGAKCPARYRVNIPRCSSVLISLRSFARSASLLRNRPIGS